MGKSTITRAKPNYENPPRRVGKLYEVVDGKFVEPKPMGAFETNFAMVLGTLLRGGFQGKIQGRAVVEMLFLLRLDPRLERRPDVAYVSFERWAAETSVPKRAAWDVIPNLAVEVVSPSNTAREMLNKVTEYFEAGVQRVWVIFPEERIIHDYASLDEMHILRGEASLEGGAILRGFSIKLADLFTAI